MCVKREDYFLSNFQRGTVREEKKTVGAKVLSKLAMIFSSLWIAILTILKALGVLEIEITDVIYSGIAIVSVWCPTYLSVWLDKIKEIRWKE